MALSREQPKPELINVHQVYGDKDVIIFLKNADHNFVEGLFYTAKHYGHSEFEFRSMKYDIVRNKDSSFRIAISAEQDFNTEQYA